MAPQSPSDTILAPPDMAENPVQDMLEVEKGEPEVKKGEPEVEEGRRKGMNRS